MEELLLGVYADDFADSMRMCNELREACRVMDKMGVDSNSDSRCSNILLHLDEASINVASIAG